MAIGDTAISGGFPIVPDDGEEGRVRWGGREINRTRDFVAQVKALIPIGKEAYRGASGISSGTGAPSTGTNGDIYYQIVDNRVVTWVMHNDLWVSS